MQLERPKPFAQMTKAELDAELTFYQRRRYDAKRAVKSADYRIRAIRSILEDKADE